MATTEERVEQVARQALGLEELRPGQAEAATAVVEGRDVLLVMPTGSGKSAVYQVAAAVREGATLVISPLIALQRDQVEALQEADAGAAAAANSTMGVRHRREVFDQLRAGALEFLFVAPEQLANEETMAEVAAARPSLFVVDEAHCISEWGHDFRPEYLRLGAAVEELGHPVVLALTATASPTVREEIADRLGMREPLVLVRGFDRPNLSLEVEVHHDADDKRRALVERAVATPGSGIVYVATRRAAEEIADELADRGVAAGAYHAGLRAAERDDVHTRFMDGDLRVVVATTAFGMGIDKADVRFVLHLDVPESVDSFYQEIGRAGRDGEPATTVLYWRQEDLGARAFFAGTSTVEPDEMARVAEVVGAADGPVAVADLQEATGLPQTALGTALARLEEAGALTVQLGGDEVVAADGAPDADAVLEAAVEAQDNRVAADRSRLQMMRGYAESRSCRRRFLLTYFGEPAPERCGNCDVCLEGGPAEAPVEGPFREQDRVRHDEFGEGLVLRLEADTVTVLFDDVGYKTLSVPLVVEGGLLSTIDPVA
jgi:ATP-dependent DNA helicase RecQ